MLDLIKKLYAILAPRERRNAVILFVLMLVTGIMETTGVASIMPFLAVVASPKVIETNKYLAWTYRYFGFDNTNSFLIFLGCGVFVVVVTSIGLKGLAQYATVRYTQMRGYTISVRLMTAYLSRPYSWFLNRHSADLGKSILSEVNQVIGSALMPFLNLLNGFILATCLIGLLLAVNPLIAVSAFVVLGLPYGLIYKLLRKYIGRIGTDRVKVNQERFQISQEAFGGIKEVKAGGLESGYIEGFKKPAIRFARYQAYSAIISTTPGYALQMIAFGGILILVVAMLNSHQSNLSEVLPIVGVFAFAGQRLLPALHSVYRSASRLKYGAPALDALYADMFEKMPEMHSGIIVNKPQDIVPMGLERHLELKNVEYTYPKSQKATLTDLNLKINAKTTVGFVGSTGAGKTTAVDVILGLLPPQKGQLIVDGTPIRSKNLFSWQKAIGYVPQQIFLADDTMTANIAFGIPSAQIDHKAVERSARAADLHEFIVNELQNGYDTLVGERGIRLSGGQRQRIGIARAMYHDPDVLIMDEATSSLDNLTEKVVMTAVHNLSSKKTIILIAHRLTTIENCDCIFLFDCGELMAQGTYSELFSMSEEFRRMAAVNE